VGKELVARALHAVPPPGRGFSGRIADRERAFWPGLMRWGMSGDPWTQLEFEAGAVFTPGSPISEPTLFSGRLDQISKIIDTISQRGYHAALYGERGVGKTSLSNVLLSYLQGPSRKFVLPRVNCDASDTFTSL
jgi:hypothetical protein